MPPGNTTISYALEARSSLAQTIKADSDAMRTLASSADRTYKELTAGMNAATRAAAELRREEDQLTGTHQRAGQSARGLWQQIAGGVTVGTLATLAIQKLGETTLDFGKSLLTNAATMESARVGFVTLTGSVAAADAELREIAAFAAKTPFNAADVRAYAQAFQGMGISAKDVIPDLTDLGNAVSAMGKGKAQLDEAALAYEQVHAKGKLAGQEILQFADAGIPVLQILSTELGITKAEVTKLSEAGQISAALWEQAFHRYSAQNWSGAMDAQSRTAQGLLSNLQDLGEQLTTSLGGPVLRVAEQEMASLVQTLSSPEAGATLADWGDKLGRVAQGAARLWDEFAAGARQVLTALRPVTDLLGDLIGLLPAVAQSDPIAPVARSAGTLATNTKAATVATGEYTAQVQAAQDVLDTMRRGDQDRQYVLDQQIAGERRKLTLLEQQWAVQDRATSISRLQAKIANDEKLARNIYSQPGQAAASRLKDERQQLEDMQTAQSREGEKNRLNNSIAGLEARKKVEDHAAQLRERTQQDEITRLQRAGDVAKKAAADAQRAQDAWTQRVSATTNEYRTMYDATLRGGTATLGSQRQVQGALGATSKVLQDVRGEADKLAQSLGFKDAPAAIKALRYDFEVFFAWLDSHLNNLNASFNHIVEAPSIAGMKLRQFLGGDLSPQNQAAIAKWDANEAALAQGKNLADAEYDRRKAEIDRQYGYSGPAPPPTGPITNPQSKLENDPTYGPTARKLLGTAGVPLSKPPGRATGGPVSAGGMYTVGERGPETFIPASDGAILPAGSAGGGGATITVEHLCPECLQRTVEHTIARSGALIGRAMSQDLRGRRRI